LGAGDGSGEVSRDGGEAASNPPRLLHVAAFDLDEKEISVAQYRRCVAAQRCSEKDLAAGFDSVSVCLSKGLGAPAGSLICGARELIRRCHRLRKMHGGGMRQVGILGAAGLHALEHNRPRLGEDHDNARALAEALAGAANLTIDLARVQTNIVMIDLTRGSAGAVVDAARELGVLLGTSGPHRIRAVTHLDVDRAGVIQAASVIAAIAATLA